jgi:DNA-binding transcriptional ArsR family regulator
VAKRSEKIDAGVCAEQLRAVADGERLRIVCMLQEGARNVTEIASELGVSVVNASHHLQVLRRAAVVSTERRGRKIYYRLADGVFPNAPGELDLGCCRLQIEPKRIS